MLSAENGIQKISNRLVKMHNIAISHCYFEEMLETLCDYHSLKADPDIYTVF